MTDVTILFTLITQIDLPDHSSAIQRAFVVERWSRQDALADPYRRFCTLFFPPKFCFQFSSGEQMLLECALMDCSDAEASTRLHLSMDAVKKRWRSICHKVDMVAPGVLGEAESGSARRRSLLRYLKHHLEELRPYRATHRRNEPQLK
jgi:hypothetical protein